MNPNQLIQIPGLVLQMQMSQDAVGVVAIAAALIVLFLAARKVLTHGNDH